MTDNVVSLDEYRNRRDCVDKRVEREALKQAHSIDPAFTPGEFSCTGDRRALRAYMQAIADAWPPDTPEGAA